MRTILFLLILTFLSRTTFSQFDSLTLRRLVIDKLQKSRTLADQQYGNELEQGVGPVLSISETFNGLSSRYQIVWTSLMVSHYIGADFAFVWDNDKSEFLDSVSITSFNEILKTCKVPLNALDKSALFCNLAYFEKINNFYLSNSKSSSLFPKYSLSKTIFENKDKNCCYYPDNKLLIEYAKISSDLAFYLPYNYRRDGHWVLSVRAFFFQSNGKLGQITDLKDTFTIVTGE